MTKKKVREAGDAWTIKQAAEKLGVPAYTVKRYCSKSLVPHIRRARNGYRMFDDAQVDWIKTLNYLQRCGFSLQEMKKYRDLCRAGDITIPERKAMLETKKRQLWQDIEELQENIDFIERRQEIFEHKMSHACSKPAEWL